MNTLPNLSNPPPDILVVDDMVANLQLLADLLRHRGFKVRPVTSGKAALQAARSKCPDLVLLDISMPQMDGYEVCEAFKKDEKLKDVPILFLSALGDELDKVRAFAAGGVDYITKPFKFEEVMARVVTHLRLHRIERELAERLIAQQELEALRDNLIHMVVHDMRSPLQAVLCALEVLATDPSTPDASEILGKALSAGRKLGGMMTTMLDINKLESGEIVLQRTLIDGPELVRELAGILAPVYPGVQLVSFADGAAGQLFGDRPLLSRVFQNLLANAMSFSKPGYMVRVEFSIVAGASLVRIVDQGPGIDPELKERIFEKFAAARTPQGLRASTGLGLAFCRLAIQAHGGQIGVESSSGKGSTFWFTLPCEGTPDREGTPDHTLN